MSGGACTHDSLLKDNHSTMSGGGCLSIDNGIESPKHRVSLGLHMNYKANDVGANHIDLGKDILVINKTQVFLDLWQTTRSKSLRQAISCHFGGRLVCELDPSPGHLMQP